MRGDSASCPTRLAAVPKYKVMLVGKTGAGKSSFGNFVLGRESFVTSSGLEVVTAKAAADSVMVEGHELYVVDTPGFGDPASSEDEHDLGIEEMVRGLQLAVEDGDPGIDMIVYVISASDRFTKEQHTAIEVIKSGDIWSYVLVVFTNADKIRSLDKRQYILDLLSKGDKCPKALKQMMDEVERRFMIVNSLNSSETYRKEQVLALLCNLHSMKKKNNGKRYSHQLFVDIHERYKHLKAHSKEQSETVSILLHSTESYMSTIDRLEEEVGRLQKELKQSKENYDEEAASKQALKENVERLERELQEKGCDRRHCLLL